MDRDIKIVIAITVLTPLLLVWGIIEFEESRCFAKYEQSYAPVSWGFMQGCMAAFNGKHVPVERIREQSL